MTLRSDSLSYDELEALPPGSIIKEMTTGTASGNDHWCTYKRAEDGLWDLENPSPEFEVLLSLSKLMGIEQPRTSVAQMREGEERQAAEGKTGVHVYSLVSLPNEEVNEVETAA